MTDSDSTAPDVLEALETAALVLAGLRRRRLTVRLRVREARVCAELRDEAGSVVGELTSRDLLELLSGEGLAALGGGG